MPNAALAPSGIRKHGRGRGLRTRSGCLTCRKRHVKCDEVRPDCTQCFRNAKTCVYAIDSQELSGVTQVGVGSTTSSPKSAEVPDLCSAQNEESVVDESSLSREQRMDATQAMSDNITSPASVETNSAYPPVGIATARWFGMLADDAAFELGPSPSQPTLEPPTNTLISLGADIPISQQSYSQKEFLSERLEWQSPTRLVLQDPEQYLFDIFVQHISLWLDLLDPYQNFASLVPRLALWNVGLLNAILALSMRHQSLQANLDGSTYAQKAALQHYQETLHYVRKALQYESYHTSDQLLATTIIISAYEMLDGSSRDWERHLQGVFWIQRSQVIHGDSGGLRAAIWWVWLCQDTWAAFRDRRKVFTFWSPQRSLSQLGPAELAARSVFIFGRVINYCSGDHAHESTASFIEKARQADALTSLLDEWAGLLTSQFTPLPRLEPELRVFKPIFIYPPLYGVSMQVHHAARLLVLLHRPTLGGIHESLKRQSVIDGHVEQIGGIACALTDYASSTLSSQCLYIAGLGTFNQRYRDEILRQIAVCRTRTGWSAASMEEELQLHWEQH